MSPRGKPLDQERVRELAAGPGAVIVCGRFEGVDERVIEGRGLRGGLDRRLRAVGRRDRRAGAARRLRAAAARRHGQEASGHDESFEDGLLEYPHYTRPREWEGRAIPEVLLSGDHGQHRAMAARARPSASRASGGRTCWTARSGRV